MYYANVVELIFHNHFDDLFCNIFQLIVNYNGQKHKQNHISRNNLNKTDVKKIKTENHQNFLNSNADYGINNFPCFMNLSNENAAKSIMR